MRFSCTKENIVQALALVSGITGKNVQLPILNNVLIRASDGGVDVVATNLELAISVALRAKVEQTGAFTVPARTLGEFVGLITAEKVDLSLDNNELVVAGGRSTTKIKGAVADEFPVIPSIAEADPLAAAASDIAGAFAAVLPAVAKTDIRPELAGVLLSVAGSEKSATLAATDSYRLAEKSVTLARGSSGVRVIVPSRAAHEIVHVLSVVPPESGGAAAQFFVSEGQIGMLYGQVRLVSRLVGGNYPDYTQIVPQAFASSATLPTSDLAKELRAAGLFTTTGVNAVTLTLQPKSQTVVLTSASAQTGEYRSELAAEVTGQETTIVLNHRYVIDGLSRISSPTVVMQLNSPDTPCLFSPSGGDSYKYIVMPIRQ